MATETELDYLENVRCGLYETIAAAPDEKTKKELRAAQAALDAEIDERYDRGERYGCQLGASNGDTDAAKARNEGKMEIKGVLKRVAAIGGQAAVNYALDLMDKGLTPEQAEQAASVKRPEGALLHRPRTAAPVPAPRLETREAEADWLRQAREHAESEWAKAMGRPVPVRQLSAEEIALAQSFNAIAQEAAGLRINEDGQRRFRLDQENADLFRRGAEAAKRIWPGR